jgi:hypothetical protein
LATWWKTLGLQAPLMLFTGVGLLGVAVCVMLLVGWFETTRLQASLRDASDRELRSVNPLTSAAMEQRGADSQDIANTVFYRWFVRSDVDYPGKLWSVWSPQMAAALAPVSNGSTARPAGKPPHDAGTAVPCIVRDAADGVLGVGFIADAAGSEAVRAEIEWAAA